MIKELLHPEKWNPNIDPSSIPIEEFDMANSDIFMYGDAIYPLFERLRNEDPVHFCPESCVEGAGAYWSVTKYNDIMSVDTNHKVFSSEGAITLFDPEEDFTTPMFIAMDPPKHDVQRKAVNPVVAPSNLVNMEGLIRERTQEVLDSLPRNEKFNWVEHVSIELTTRIASPKKNQSLIKFGFLNLLVIT